MRRGFLFFTVIAIILCVPVSAYNWSTNPGDGSPGNPYQISTPEQLNAIGLDTNLLDKCFILTADIDMSAYTGTQYNIIGKYIAGITYTPFTGTFDGNGYVVSGLTYTTVSQYDQSVGMFGYISDAIIKNLGLENVNISSEHNCAGGLIGYQYESTIIGCYTTGLVRSSYVINSYPQGAGGLVGDQSLGEIIDCYSTASVTSPKFAGGLVGYAQSGTITDSYAKGTVVSGAYAGGSAGRTFKSTITSCYSSSIVSVPSASSTIQVGGLIGSDSHGSIRKCFSNGEVTAFSDYIAFAGGLTGMTHTGTIADCYSTASVTATSITSIVRAGGLIGYLYTAHEADRSFLDRCYSAGRVTVSAPRPDNGGLVGTAVRAVVSNCFWDIQTSGRTTSDVGIGKTTAQMQNRSTFAGWDFDTVWVMDGCPVLQWQISPLQPLIDAAADGDVIVVEPGVYEGRLHFKGKHITLTSIDPADPNVVAATVLRGRGMGSVVTFKGTENETCVLEGFTITGGYTTIKGGGINGNQCLATVRRCRIRNNIADGCAGGGIWGIYGLIEACVIRDNHAANGGGIAKCDGLVKNTLIYGNTASMWGQAVNNCDGTIQNCTIVGADVLDEGLISNCDGLIDSSILHCDSGAIFANCTAVTQYCCWPEAAGEGDIDVDPLFVDPNTANTCDFSLLSDSFCINAGNPNYIPEPGETDLNGNARLYGLRVDIGCYEFPNTTPAANAGEDVTAYAWIDGLAEVSLDGSGSYDADGDVLEYFWFNDANEVIAEGAEPAVVLPVGEHVISLIVNDGIEDSEPDSCVVTVIAAEETTGRVLPRSINLKSRRGRIIGQLEFAGAERPELDAGQKMLLLTELSQIEAVQQDLVYSDAASVWYLVAIFDAADVLDNLPVGDEVQITLVSRLESGPWVYGVDTVKVKDKAGK